MGLNLFLITSSPSFVTTTTARSAKTAELIATALRLNPGHEEDASFRLKLSVYFPADLKIGPFGTIMWWFKSMVPLEQAEDGEGIVVTGTVKKDHFICRDGMAAQMAKYGCKLLEEAP